MSLTSFSSGVNTSFSSELNNNYSELLTQTGLNTIRSLIDRSGVWSAGEIDGWGEAYIDLDGREDSVNTSTTTAIHSFYDAGGYNPDITLENTYYPNFTDEASSDTTHDPDSFTNPSNAFDSDDATYAEKAYTTSPQTRYLGKTFSAKTVEMVRVKLDASWSFSSGGGASFDVDIETYDGSSWSSLKEVYSTATYSPGGSSVQTIKIDGALPIGSSIQGIRVAVSVVGSNQTASYVKIYSIEYGSMTSSSNIYHTIPSGTFSSTISSSFGTGFIKSTETDATITYKLSNAADDSGWLTSNEISTFTAFTSEPTTLTVKLTPKSSSPTSGYPSIKGFWVRAS